MPATGTGIKIPAILAAVAITASPSFSLRDDPPLLPPIFSRADPRLEPLRRAAATWELKPGPPRQVIDQVCLVPDEATFFEVLATWDARHFFPILIDDVELNTKFLQAFRPAKIIRRPGKSKPIDAAKRWDAAVTAVGDAWTTADVAADQKLRGDAAPRALGPTPPGVVLGSAESPSLPGLAALAAGRFQPLVRLESTKHYADALNEAELGAFINLFDAAVGSVAPDHQALGDDCDFVTVAGDFPYKYNGKWGARAVDDRLARSGPNLERWAFVGRIMGDAKPSVYAAMCSLFLTPDSALMFDGYNEGDRVFAPYALRAAADKLRALVPTTLVVGDRRATLRGWHETFDPANRHAVVFVNTMGEPSAFSLSGSPAHAFDVAPSRPAAVYMIHSYSAADPTDPGTIAGRWLAQGAFLYHGSMDEPYLQAFRLPRLVADLFIDGIPFGPATTTLNDEVRAPWKLVVLGDPLHRLDRRYLPAGRNKELSATSTWSAYASNPEPAADATPMARFAWAINQILVRQTSTHANPRVDDLVGVLSTIPRDALAPSVRPIFDDLRIFLLEGSGRYEDAWSVSLQIPPAEKTPVVARLETSSLIALLQRAVDGRDVARAAAVWTPLMLGPGDVGFKRQITARVAALADNPQRREVWRLRMGQALKKLEKPDVREVVAAEIKRIDVLINGDRR